MQINVWLAVMMAPSDYTLGDWSLHPILSYEQNWHEPSTAFL